MQPYESHRIGLRTRKEVHATEGLPDEVTQARDTQDWMFDRKRYHDLNLEYGPFTLDAAANANGDNAQCKQYCSKARSFLDQDCKGQTIWMNPPFDRIEEFLGHYLKQKEADPSIAGMFVLPQWESATWWSKVRDWARVKRYQQGSDLFTAPAVGKTGERRRLGPT